MNTELKERADKEAKELLYYLSLIREESKLEIVSLNLQAFASGEIANYIQNKNHEQTTSN